MSKPDTSRCWLCHLRDFPPMKIAVLSGNMSNYDELAFYTIGLNKREYCDRHGYDLRVLHEVRPKYQDNRSHANGFSWSRLEEMADMVESGKWEWVWCVGCDTLVTNLTLRLEELAATTDRHVLISGERVAPLQADSFLVRSTAEGIGWLRDILGCYAEYKHHGWVENQAMIDRMERHSDITEIVPQWRLNAYDYRRFYHLDKKYRDGTDCYGNRGQWQDGDFLIHWPAATLGERFEFLMYYYPRIIR